MTRFTFTSLGTLDAGPMGPTINQLLVLEYRCYWCYRCDRCYQSYGATSFSQIDPCGFTELPCSWSTLA